MASTTGIPPRSEAPVARVLGSLLGRAFAVGQQLRHPRPIHPRGVVLSGHVRWIPDAVPSGIAWIDRGSERPVPVVARVSRSIGLPAPLPDIIGLALRVDTGGEPADIELASTGWTVPARFVLLPHRRAERARFGTLFPYRGERGPVLVGARTRSGRPPATDPREAAADDDVTWSLTLGHAAAVGTWHPFAVVDLREDADQIDAGLRFDAVRRPLPGSRAYAWVRAARQPSYARVQPDNGEVRMPR